MVNHSFFSRNAGNMENYRSGFLSAAKIILTLFLSLVFCSCSINALVVSQMAPVLENSVAALYEETDLHVAEQALASNLKLIEGMLKSEPDNESLLLLAAQGWAGYALGFAEDDEPDRAKVFYLRARDYGLRILRRQKEFGRAENQDTEALINALRRFNKNDTPALFWSGFAWAGFINLSLDNPTALSDLPKVQLIMQRVEELDPAYFYGAVYLFLGSVYGMKPKIMGGDPEKAKVYFQKNFDLNQGRFLLANIYAAKYYAAKILDEPLFDQYLEQIETAPSDILPGGELLTQIAKQKARKLKEMKEKF